jgi:hypothetical protein
MKVFNEVANKTAPKFYLLSIHASVSCLNLLFHTCHYDV